MRPRLAVCGHIHDGRGAERVTWDLGRPNVRYAEEGVAPWEDPGEGRGSKKMSLVDLTGRKAPSLANDGSRCARSPASGLTTTTLSASEGSPAPPATFGSDAAAAAAAASQECRGTVGLGGDPRSARCDREALEGRTGRRETCVVNAAIMKSRFPHIGGKRSTSPSLWTWTCRCGRAVTIERGEVGWTGRVAVMGR